MGILDPPSYRKPSSGIPLSDIKKTDLDSSYTQNWLPNVSYAAGTLVLQSGVIYARITAGVSRTVWDTTERGLWAMADSTRPFSIKDFGAKGDASESRNANATAGSNTVTLSGAFNRPFVAGRDEGRLIAVAGAGTSGGWLTSTIVSIQSTTQATIADSAATTVTNANAWWGVDDTTFIQAALNAAGNFSALQARRLFIPNGVFLVTAPLIRPGGVTIQGQGSSSDTRYFGSSAIVAFPTFSGTDIIRIKAIDDGTTEPSDHWTKTEHLLIVGTGKSGPRGMNVGSSGETMEIANVYIKNCSSGIYMYGSQASFTARTISVFGCQYGVNCDGVNSTVRIFGLSGDDNTSIVRVKGGKSANVCIYSLKAESYNTGNGDPLIDIVDLDGGVFCIFGGWADANSARTTAIRVTKTTATGRPGIITTGFKVNDVQYTNLVQDTTGPFNNTIPAAQAGNTNPFVALNSFLFMDGSSSARVQGYGANDLVRQSNGTASIINGMRSDNRWFLRNPSVSTSSSGIRIEGSDGSLVAEYDDKSDRMLGLYTHLVARGTAPSVSAGSAAGSSPSINVTGADLAHSVSITPGSSPASGVLCTITFNKTFASAPKIAVTPTNASSASAGLFVSAKTTSSVTISCTSTPSSALTFDVITVG